MADLPAPGHSMDLAYALDWTGVYGNSRAEISTVVNTYLIWAQFFGVDAPGLADLDACIADAVASGKKVIFIPSLSPGDGTMTADALAGLDVAASYWPLPVLFDEPGGNSGDQAFVEGLLASWATALSDRTLATVDIYVNFSGTALRTATGKNAAGIDFMGAECYLPGSVQNNPDVAGLMTAEVQALKLIMDATSPGRDTFYFIQGYTGNVANGVWTNLEALRNIQTPPYLQSVGDATCVALFIFSWERPGGTQSLPDCIRTEHERIWGAIDSTPQPATISCSSPPPFHSGRKLYLSRTQYPEGAVTYPVPPGTVP